MQQETMARKFGHSTNLVGLPTDLLASLQFNDHPVPLRISGLREMNPNLFEMLGQAETPSEAGEAFYNYMMAVFGIDPEQMERERVEAERDGVKVRRYRASFLRLLKGWGYDSNGPEGAVLKGWVESRFGLFPTFHKEIILPSTTDAWMTYVAEKMSSRFHNNSIYCQLDMLYEFCQWTLSRFAAAGQTHLTLYRGINDFDEHPVVKTIDKKTAIMRMNSLASFTADREIADCFGDHILTVQVPTVKIVFFNTLLPVHALKGEGEYLVIGGDYRVISSYY
jgi:NAD+--dinitrogen-reductase ADP-D-ribosyltransferase